MDFSLTKEQLQFQDRIRAFLQEELAPVVEEIESAAVFPMDFYKRVGAKGLLGINFPGKYGGQDADVWTCALLIEEMSKLCSGVAGAVTTAGMTSPSLLLAAGTEAQKERYLHGVATGETITSFAITEPNCGSDVTNLSTRAVAEGDSYRINGGKVFITNGSVANIFLVVAKTGDERKRFSVFLIERDSGLLGKQEVPQTGLGVPGHDRNNAGRCGRPKRESGGARGKGVAACYGPGEFYQDNDGRHWPGGRRICARSRLKPREGKKQMGKPLASQQGIRSEIARLAVEVEAARFLVYHAAWMLDKGLRNRKETAMAKFYATEVAKRITKQTLRLYGIDGFSKKHQAAIFFSDTPVFTIADGTSEIQLENISRELGLLQSGGMGS